MNLEKYWSTRISAIQTQELRDLDSQYCRLLGDVPKNSNVLEIGPGNGAYAIFLNEKYQIPNSQFTLLDLSDSTVKKLQETRETSGFNVTLNDSIDFLRNSQQRYDLIVMRHVLEHMDKAYIAELLPLLDARLNDGWRIVIELPNFLNIPYGIWTCFGDFSHMTIFTPETLTEAFLWNFRSDFEIKTYPVNIKFPPVRNLKWIISGLIYYTTRKLSTFLSWIFYGWDRFWTGKAFTPLFTAVITKKSNVRLIT